MKYILILFIFFIISCGNSANKDNSNVQANSNDAGQDSQSNKNTINDIPLEESILKYSNEPSMDIITNLIAVSVNNTLKEGTNIVNVEDTEYDFSVTFDEGTTALMIASYYGYTDLVSSLIKEGADVNLKNKKNYTALFYATDIWTRQGIGIYESNFDVVKLLVDNKADVNAVNNNGKTPLFYAVDNSNSDVVKYLIDNGANIDIVTKEGITLLLIATDVECIKLLAKTTNINKANDDGVTALISVARFYGYPEAIRALIENGADVNALDKDQNTALSSAIENGNFEAALILLDNNANPNLGNKTAKDLGNIAKDLGNEEIAAILYNY